MSERPRIVMESSSFISAVYVPFTVGATRTVVGVQLYHPLVFGTITVATRGPVDESRWTVNDWPSNVVATEAVKLAICAGVSILF